MVFLLRFEAATTGPRCDPVAARCLARGGARRGRGIARPARSEATEGWGHPRVGHSPCPAGVRCAVGFADRGSPLDVVACKRGNFGSKPLAYPHRRSGADKRSATPGALPVCGLNADRSATHGNGHTSRIRTMRPSCFRHGWVALDRLRGQFGLLLTTGDVIRRAAR
jgi:hypothetical protein